MGCGLQQRRVGNSRSTYPRQQVYVEFLKKLLVLAGKLEPALLGVRYYCSMDDCLHSLLSLRQTDQHLDLEETLC